MPTFNFDPSSANFLKALPLHPRAAIVTTTVGRLEQLLEDPLNLQPQKLKARADLAEEIELNSLVQRTFTGRKKTNVKAYAAYLRELILGERTGGVPPMHLWTQSELELTTAATTAELQYLLATPDTTFLAIDGQTQLAAYFELLRNATPEFKKIIRNWPVAAVVHHGIDVYFARQLFYDLNVLGVVVNTAQGLGMNTIDPLMKIVRYLEESVPDLTGRIEKAARQIRKDSPNLMTIQTLRQMTVNVGKGIAGVQYGAKPVPTDDLDIDRLTEVTKAFIDALVTAFPLELADRNNSVLPAASTLAAVSAMAHDVYRDDLVGPYQTAKIHAIISELRQVDWRKSGKWNGIAGKLTDKGLAIGGPKEVGYNIYRALTDRESDTHAKIRKPAQIASGDTSHA
ncbi:MAG: DNA sulfur modification protein DndB [Vulcanimicrobiaceae bacterium]